MVLATAIFFIRYFPWPLHPCSGLLITTTLARETMQMTSNIRNAILNRLYDFIDIGKRLWVKLDTHTYRSINQRRRRLWWWQRRRRLVIYHVTVWSAFLLIDPCKSHSSALIHSPYEGLTSASIRSRIRHVAAVVVAAVAATAVEGQWPHLDAATNDAAAMHFFSADGMTTNVKPETDRNAAEHCGCSSTRKGCRDRTIE